MAELRPRGGSHVGLGVRPRDDHAGRDGHQECRDLRDESVTDGEQRVLAHCVADRQAALDHADRDSADDVDDDDDDSGDRVALDELGGTVHRAIEVRFGRDLGPALAGLHVGDQAGVEVGVNSHLLAGHCVKGEPRSDLGDSLGTLRDHHKLDDDENEEDHGADDDRAADRHMAERADHLARIAVAEHETRRSNIETEAEQRRHEQQRGKHREIERLLDKHRGEESYQREHDVDDDQQVEHEGRDRHDEQQDDADDSERHRELREVLIHLQCPPAATR